MKYKQLVALEKKTDEGLRHNLEAERQKMKQ